MVIFTIETLFLVLIVEVLYIYICIYISQIFVQIYSFINVSREIESMLSYKIGFIY